MGTDDTVRLKIANLLREGGAHMTFDEAVSDFPESAMNTPFPNGNYSPWHLLEHMRRTQKDILSFITNPDYIEPEWPKDYWPATSEKADATAWRTTVTQFHVDRDKLVQIIEDPSIDLYSDIPHGNGQNILREMLLAADHNSYHTGEFAIMRQVMGTWGQSHAR